MLVPGADLVVPRRTRMPRSTTWDGWFLDARSKRLMRSRLVLLKAIAKSVGNRLELSQLARCTTNERRVANYCKLRGGMAAWYWFAMASAQGGPVFTLERYRGEWSPLGMASVPLLAMIGSAILFHLLEPVVSKHMFSVIAWAGAGVVLLLVLLTPWRHRRWRAKGRLELRLTSDKLSVVDPVTGRVVGGCDLAAERVLPGQFEYSIDTETVRGVPAFTLELDGGSRISVGVPMGWYVWRSAAVSMKRPDYEMQGPDWKTFLELMGLTDRMVKRVGVADVGGGPARPGSDVADGAVSCACDGIRPRSHRN